MRLKRNSHVSLLIPKLRKTWHGLNRNQGVARKHDE
jgi:hypothetical protein